MQQGILNIQDPVALGPTPVGSPASAGSVTVTGGALEVQGTFTINKPLTLNGVGFSTDAALQAHNLNAATVTTVTWSGPITLGSTTAVGADSMGQLTLQGAIGNVSGGSGAGSIGLFKDGGGTLVFPAGTINTYLGPTTLVAGITIVSGTTALGDPTGAGVTVGNGATLELSSANGIDRNQQGAHPQRIGRAGHRRP